MKPKALLFPVTLLVAATLPAFAEDRIKQDNATALNDPGSWDTLPGSGDVAVWDSTVTGANNPELGADLSWAGIRIADPGGLVTIGTGSNILTLGTSGIDLSSATQSLHLNGASLNVAARRLLSAGGP